jgi:nucleoside-diphosphate-sugar epimerase
LKILFIGGNGNISWHCVSELIQAGHNVVVLNRRFNTTTRKVLPAETGKILCDIRNIDNAGKILEREEFDVVCDFICYNSEQAKNAIALFKEKTNQYIFISSDSVYKRETKNLPYQENCPQNNPETSCSYVAGKIEAERIFKSAFEDIAFPVTIVRPAYTYDTIVPVSIGGNCFTAPQRYIDGKPVLIAGDGINLGTFTHSNDFAAAFTGILGNPEAIGEDFHITSDEWLTWNEMLEFLVSALHIKNPNYIHIPMYDILESNFAANQKDIIYQKMFHNIYDNSKIKRTVPGWKAKISFAHGIKQTINWLFEKDSYRRIIPELDMMLEELTVKYEE